MADEDNTKIDVPRSVMLQPLRDMLKGIKIVLTSPVPERKQLLESVGIEPIIEKSHCYARFNSLKFEAVRKIHRNMSSTTSKVAFDMARKYELSKEKVIIMGVCSLVEYNDELMGKPLEPITAKRMLSKLNGDYHKVHTGIYLLLVGGISEEEKSQPLDRRFWRHRYFETVSTVKMKHVSRRMLDEYIALEDGLQFPGGYNVNGPGISLVETIEGCHNNVRGFPLFKTCNEIRKLLETTVWSDNVVKIDYHHEIEY